MTKVRRCKGNEIVKVVSYHIGSFRDTKILSYRMKTICINFEFVLMRSLDNNNPLIRNNKFNRDKTQHANMET